MSDDAGHARHRLVPQFNSPVRLSIMAALAAVDDMEFGATELARKFWEAD